MSMEETPEMSASPDGLSTLPGLGLIRIRSLRKAGWSTLEALQNATLDELRAVPGFSERLATSLYAHLHPVDPEVELEAEDAEIDDLEIDERELDELEIDL